MAVKSGKLRGVNLGGWLVLEKWMTPSLFKGTSAADEYTFMQSPGSRERLDSHRATFITEKDFKWIARSGLNAVRIPVGYWLLRDDGPLTSGIDYLDWAMDMAVKYGLYVLIDFHGAKGSQNGNDHSGRIGRPEWYGSGAYREETVDSLLNLTERYRDSPALWGIELLNEPKINPVTYFTLRKFYRAAYRELQSHLYPGTYIIFSDAFLPGLFSGSLRQAPGYPTVMDMHLYQFGKTDLQGYFEKLERRPERIAALQKKQPVIIGEWSGMLSHESLAGFSPEEKDALQTKHIDEQMRAYASALGWFYWTYKTEEKGIWNFRWLCETGRLRLG